MTLTELVQVGVALGASGTGVGGVAILVIRLVTPHIVKMREAKAALLHEQAKADTARSARRFASTSVVTVTRVKRSTRCACGRSASSTRCSGAA
jgi:hypothetical protein